LLNQTTSLTNPILDTIPHYKFKIFNIYNAITTKSKNCILKNPATGTAGTKHIIQCKGGEKSWLRKFWRCFLWISKELLVKNSIEKTKKLEFSYWSLRSVYKGALNSIIRILS
jgi:hypothetical protein